VTMCGLPHGHGGVARGRLAIAARAAALAALGALVVLGLGACRSAEGYRRAADMAVYAVISEKAAVVPGMERSFSIEAPEAARVAPRIDEAARIGSPLVLSLADAIMVAAAHNRDFQRERESLYLKALDYTYQRYQFAPHFMGALSAMFERRGGEESVQGDARFGVSQALATGADVGLTLTSSFVRFLTGDPRESAESILKFTLTQPLGRGAGRRIARENLVQAEREVIYQMRSFVRFRREFFVSVASDYFRVLQQRDVVANERMNLDNLAAARERAQMLFDAGRLPGVQVDQAEQDELRARDRWVRAQQSYESALDEFKIKLGLPADMDVALDPEEMVRLRSAGLVELSGTREDAARIALARRLDLVNASDQVEDSQRKVAVAEDDLGPDVELVLSATLGTDAPTSAYSGAIDVELPLDRLRERNDYRRSLIELSSRLRSCDLLRDRVVQQVYGAWRRLEEARTTYEIQRRSVALAEQRAESTMLLIEAGRAEMRDLLEAQEALVRARNDLTGALVSYRVAMLELWRDMGVLAFRDNQFIQEGSDVESTDAS